MNEFQKIQVRVFTRKNLKFETLWEGSVQAIPRLQDSVEIPGKGKHPVTDVIWDLASGYVEIEVL